MQAFEVKLSAKDRKVWLQEEHKINLKDKEETLHVENTQLQAGLAEALATSTNFHMNHSNWVQVAEAHLVQLAHLQVKALQAQPSASTCWCIRNYLDGRRDNISCYVKGFHVDLATTKRRLTWLARLYPNSRYLSKEESRHREDTVTGDSRPIKHWFKPRLHQIDVGWGKLCGVSGSLSEFVPTESSKGRTSMLTRDLTTLGLDCKLSSVE